MSVLEAFACGTPVLGSRIGGIPELVKEGETGALFEPGDISDLRRAAASLWGDAQLCAAMGGNARRLVENKYSPQKHYDKIISVYQQVKRT
jgi:glycosyltransferase involved in cell wall biosynthesis